VTRGLDDQGSAQAGDGTGAKAPEAPESIPSAPASDESAPSGDNGEPPEQLDLPLEALLDWGSEPVEVDEELKAQSEQALLAAERDEYLDSLQRLQADFDNFRKRSIRQQTELLEHATEGLCVRLLPVLDALDLATAHVQSQDEVSDSGKALVQIDALLRDILAREGIERIDAVGVPFDPTIHDAVGHVPAEPLPSVQAGHTPVPGDTAKPARTPATAGAGGHGSPTTSGHGSAGTLRTINPAKAEKTVPQDGGPTVAQVMRAGYRMKSKVLRPAMVLVRD